VLLQDRAALQWERHIGGVLALKCLTFQRWLNFPQVLTPAISCSARVGYCVPEATKSFRRWRRRLMRRKGLMMRRKRLMRKRSTEAVAT